MKIKRENGKVTLEGISEKEIIQFITLIGNLENYPICNFYYEMRNLFPTYHKAWSKLYYEGGSKKMNIVVPKEVNETHKKLLKEMLKTIKQPRDKNGRFGRKNF